MSFEIFKRHHFGLASAKLLFPFREVRVTSPVLNIDIELPEGFQSYRLRLTGLKSDNATASDLHMRISEDGGSTFEAGVSSYSYLSSVRVPGDSVLTNSEDAQAFVKLNRQFDVHRVGNAAPNIWTGELSIQSAGGSLDTPFNGSWRRGYMTSDVTNSPRIGGGSFTRLAATTATDVRLFLATGASFVAGKASLFVEK